MKNKLLFILALLFTTSIFSQKPIALQHAYEFTNGNLIDIVGNYNLTSENGLETTITDNQGNSNAAINVNSEYLSTNGTSIPALSQSEAISISFWIKTSNNNTTQKILAHYSNSFSYGWKFFLINGKLAYECQNYTQNLSNKPIKFTSPTSIADGNWHHVALVFSQNRTNNATNTYNFFSHFYIDGVYTNNQSVKTPATITTFKQYLVNNDVGIKIGSNTNNNNFDGAIDDIKYYKGHFQQSDVLKLYNNSPRKIIHVNAQTSNTNPDGLTWANAFSNLNDAIQKANTDILANEIWVAKGTYIPTSNTPTQNDSFEIVSDIKLYGGFNGTETQLNERDWKVNKTILSGDKNKDDVSSNTYNHSSRSDNLWNVIKINALANNVVLDGITISGGNATSSNSSDPSNSNRAGAIFKDNSGNNFTLKNTIIENNHCNREGNVRLTFNNGNNNVLVENCIFRNNISKSYGANLKIDTYTNSTTVNFNLYNSLFYNNIVENTNSSYSGSSLILIAHPGTINTNIINNTFTKNIDAGTASTNNDKGTILMRSKDNSSDSNINANVHNNIFYNNYSDKNGTVNTNDIGLFNYPNNLIKNLNFSNNRTTANLSVLNGKATIKQVSGNINTQPNFIDEANNDFHLTANSGLVNAGFNGHVPASLLVDLDYTKRIQDVVVDLGAYEYGNATLSTNSNELNNNLTIYPNPVQKTLFIKTNTNIKNIIIYNMLGKELKKTNNKQINVSTLPKGLYLLKIHTINEQELTKKFIVN